MGTRPMTQQNECHYDAFFFLLMNHPESLASLVLPSC
jgi:hypothetical protein